VVTTPATSDGPAQGTALARSQAARRRRVLDAALRLAERGGFDAVQMRDVATEANVALGTVYRYFTSKERLLLEAMVEEIEALASRLESRPPVGATPADRIVERKRLTMKPMRPEEAALQMDLLGHDFFLFTNAENGHAAVLYRRRDGNLGVIETTG